MFRERLREILDKIEIEDDGACGDPECCGDPIYAISDKSKDKALSEILKLVKSEIVPEAKNCISDKPIDLKIQPEIVGLLNNVGWNNCRQAILTNLGGEDEK